MPDKDNSRTVFTTNGDSVKIKRSLGQIGKLNKSVQTMMQQIKAYPLTRGAKQQQQLKDFRDQINSVIDKETDRIVSADSGATGKDIATFLNVTFKKAKGANGGLINMRGFLQNQSLEELMNDPKGQYELLMSDRYKNINSLYEDIRLVTEQIAELAEVIDTFRDAIVNSDKTISSSSFIT